ncbi:LysR family transcriptional regulator [Duganella sp. FT80W]|uniref:LysR family transcriptional regulator n=1 Tax=Duganella guangzhouensis TaxID=2666084 RepID=A0A6I2L1L0_9BURK|nr:LysR family transcriptional regulator [Duganella guangzhouensis]MRW90654.1 LysR family transcriptional regulator [Duganella guangzhouensis]
MDQIHLMQVFVAVGEQESFVGASRRLDLSPASVTRAIGGLEALLGVRLLRRTTRNVRLTEVGRRYLSDSREILASIAEANEVAAGGNVAPKGELSVTAPAGYGRLFIMPCIVEFLKRYPEVEVSGHFLDRVVNLVDEGIDVAVRIGHLPDSSAKGLRVGQVRRVLCASPEYLARHGVPQSPSDLQRHTIVATAGVEWKFGTAGNRTAVRIKPRLTVTSNDEAMEAVLAGLGICRLMCYQVDAALAAGRLKIILAEHEEAPLPVHILHRESQFGSPKVRHFIDLLAASLRTHPHMRG